MTTVWRLLIISILLLFLGWLPKIAADGVYWYLDNDFAHLYITGKLVDQGLNPYTADLGPLYGSFGFTPTRTIPGAGAPPALAALMMPFALLSPPLAFAMWTILQVVSLLAGVFLLTRFLDLPVHKNGLMVLLIASVAPLGVFAHIRYGQTQLLMFLLVVAGLIVMTPKETPRKNVALKESGAWRIGAALWGVSVSLKLFTVPLAYIVFRYRGISGLCWFCIGFLTPLLPFVAFSGHEGIETFVQRTVPYIQNLAPAFDGNISLSGALAWMQREFFSADVISLHSLQLVCMFLVLPVIILDLRAAPDIAASTFTILTASCLLSPTAWPHYVPLLSGSYLYLAAKAMCKEQPKPLLLGTVFLYACMASVLGVLSSSDLLTQVISAVWGPVCMIAMICMLFEARKIPNLKRQPV